jgi:hypothetical protein
LSEQTDEVVALAGGGGGGLSGALASGCNLWGNAADASPCRIGTGGVGGGGGGTGGTVARDSLGGCSHAILWSENSGVLLSRFVDACCTVDSTATGLLGAAGALSAPVGSGARCRGLEKKVKFMMPSALGRGC